MKTLILATRSSPLALWQARYVADLLRKNGLETELLPMETTGDRKLEVSLSKIGEKGLFTMELEAMLLKGNAHLAVHSAKDMPSQLPSGLDIVAFTKRENPSDVLVSYRPDVSLADEGIRIGTSSTRRTAMLKRYAPGAVAVGVRGNLQTRFRKMLEGACDAMLLARAGVVRMGYEEFIREELPVDVFTPAAGQASLAVEAATHLEPELKASIRQVLNHFADECAISAERSFLKKMEGGCSIPVFALCAPDGDGNYHLNAGVISLDGSEEIRRHITIPASESGNYSAFCKAGEQLAREVLLSGGADILQAIREK
jgi:hydroxymethylbilane synthase